MGGSAAIASDLSFLIILPLLACCSSSLLALLGLRQRDTRKSNWAAQALLSGASNARGGGLTSHMGLGAENLTLISLVSLAGSSTRGQGSEG